MTMKPKYSRWLISSQPQPPAPYLVSNRPLTTPLTLFFFVRRHLEACRGDRSREIRSLAAQSSTRDCGNGFDSIGRKSETSNLVVENTHGTSGYETVTGWLKTCRVQVHRKPVTRWLKIHRVQVHVKLVTRCLEKKKGGQGHRKPCSHKMVENTQYTGACKTSHLRIENTTGYRCIGNQSPDG